MNAVADKIGFCPTKNPSLSIADGAEVHVGDKVEILRIDEPQPHSNVVDTSRLPASMAGRYR